MASSGSWLPDASVSVGQGLRDLFQAVLDRVPDRRALGLVANLRDDVPLGVLHHHLEAHAGVGRPAAPVARRAAGLPGVEHVSLDDDVAAALDDFEALFAHPLLLVVLALARSVAGFPAPAVLFEFLDRRRLEALESPAGEIDPVGVL